MNDQNKLPLDVEEQIQSLASDVYIQVEEKLTHLITTAVKAEMNKSTAQQNKNLSEQEQSLHKDFSDKYQLQTKKFEQLKQALAEKEIDEETTKQNFQVEITQNTINYTETIELLENKLSNLKQQSSSQQHEKQRNTHKLEDRLLEVEQNLNDSNQKIDGLNGRIMVLTEQELSLTRELVTAQENTELNNKYQYEMEAAVKAEVSAKQQVDILTEKLQELESHSVRIQAEALQSSDNKITAFDQKTSQLVAQVKQEQNGKSELQQELSIQQKVIDTAHDKIKQAEQRNKDYQEQIIKLTNKATIDKQQLLDDVTDISENSKQVKQQHLDEIADIKGVAEQVKQQHLDEIADIKGVAEQVKQQHLDEIADINDVAEQVKQQHFDEIADIKGVAEQVKQQHFDEIADIKGVAEQVKQQHFDEIADINDVAEQVKQQHFDEIADIKGVAEQVKQQHFDEIADIKGVAEQVKQQHLDEIADIKGVVEQVKQQHLDEIADINDVAEQVKQQHFDEIADIKGVAEQVKQQHLDEIADINDVAEQVKQQHFDEIAGIKEAGKEAVILQSAAQQNIIELEKSNDQLLNKVEVEKNEVKLYQQEITVLTDQVKVAQQGEENILQRFNNNREKQEIENNIVREAIKSLRDENHQLIRDIEEQKAQFSEKINETEHKLTEYRLKFEYAQKKLMN